MLYGNRLTLLKPANLQQEPAFTWLIRVYFI